MDGLTKGGKQLLDSILSRNSNWTVDQNIIRQVLDADGMLPERWEPSYYVNGVHVVDANAGVTLSDYSLIKAHLMLIGRWE